MRRIAVPMLSFPLHTSTRVTSLKEVPLQGISRAFLALLQRISAILFDSRRFGAIRDINPGPSVRWAYGISHGVGNVHR